MEGMPSIAMAAFMVAEAVVVDIAAGRSIGGGEVRWILSKSNIFYIRSVLDFSRAPVTVLAEAVEWRGK